MVRLYFPSSSEIRNGEISLLVNDRAIQRGTPGGGEKVCVGTQQR